MLGDELAIFALLLREKHNGGGALAIAAILAAGHLPLFLLAPWAGNVADRVPVRRLIPIAGVIQAALAALIAFNQSLVLSLALISLIGAGQAFTGPAWVATLPDLVGKEALPRAMSLIQALYALAGIAGPGIAGLMVSKLGYVSPLLTDAVTFALLAAVPAFLALPSEGRATGSRVRGDIWVGLHTVRCEPVIRSITILLFSLILTLGAFSVAELFFALDDLHASTFVYGLIVLSRDWLNEFKADKKRKPAVIVGEVRNLSHEHISVSTFVQEVQRNLINSGKVKFVASSTEREEIRGERSDQDINASEATRKAMGKEKGADFMLKGTINTIIDANGSDQVRYYQVNLTLISLVDNEIVWNGEKKIKKFVARSNLRF